MPEVSVLAEFFRKIYFEVLEKFRWKNGELVGCLKNYPLPVFFKS